jgi:hypothetical protein
MISLNLRNLQGSLGADDYLDSDRIEIDDVKRIKNHNSEFGKFTEYMDKTNIAKITKGDVREEMRSNLKDLLEKINTNPDMKAYNQFDKKKNSMLHNSIKFTPITTFNQNNESETNKFKKNLRDKLNSLTVVDKTSKENAILNLKSNSPFNDGENNEKKNYDSRTNSSGRKMNMTMTLNLPNLDNHHMTHKSQISQMSNTSQISQRTQRTQMTQMRRTLHTAEMPPTTNHSTLYTNNNHTEYENFKEYDVQATNYRDFRIPAKKSYFRKKQNESIKKKIETDPYLSTIKNDNYNSIKYKNSFREEYKFEKSSPEGIASLSLKSNFN